MAEHAHQGKARGWRAHAWTLAAAVVLAGSIGAVAATPAFAQAEATNFKEGSITVFMKDGHMMQMQVSDSATLDQITKGARQLPDHAMVVMHNGKLFLVMDHKMANGMTVSQLLEHMNQH